MKKMLSVLGLSLMAVTFLSTAIDNPSHPTDNAYQFKCKGCGKK